MTPALPVIRPAAARDIDEQADYLAQRNEALGERFLQAATQTIRDIVSMPGLGSVCPVASPGLQNLRTWPIRGFRKHLVYYVPTGDGIEVVRVLHGARDTQRILEET
jgi:toxin ParE1/3/4